MNESVKPGETLAWIVALVVSILLVGALFIGGCAGVKAFQRSQKRADANNNVALTDIQVRNQAQYAKVIEAHNATVQAQAEQRYLEAVGIRRAQDEISKTLTPLYVQHEAIQAEQTLGASGRNNTFVYIPSGPGGVPLVNTTPSPKP